MKKPNILYILADDLGWCDLGAGGSDFYESPNIDRIATEGMLFTQGYATCQVCSPSRASILTGKYTPRHGVTDWIGAPCGEDWRMAGRHTKLLPPENASRLGDDEITFAELFRRSGYRTFFAGKWHLGGEGSYPEDYGFEINKGGWDVGSPNGGYFAPWINPKLKSGPDGESLPLRLARETSEFMTDNKDEPFLAYLSFYSVHAPLQTSQDRWEKFRQKAVTNGKGKDGSRFIFDRRLPVRQVQDSPVYAGMIEAMDDAVGVVLDKLDELGISENTIVVFTSDNGGVSSGDAFSSSMLPLRGGKGRQWEGGIREPVYIRYPGVVKSGSSSDVPVSGIDFYPTFAELAGIFVPPEQEVDGKSMVPLFGSLEHGAESIEQDKKWREISERDLFWHYPHYGNQGGDPSSIIRSGKWKLIHYYEDGHDELYDLKYDEGELNNVAETNDEKVAELRCRLDKWLLEVDAKIPIPDPLYDTEKEREYLDRMEFDLMPKLEAEHAEYLNADWAPGDDWWGSQVVVD